MNSVANDDNIFTMLKEGSAASKEEAAKAGKNRGDDKSDEAFDVLKGAKSTKSDGYWTTSQTVRKEPEHKEVTFPIARTCIHRPDADDDIITRPPTPTRTEGTFESISVRSDPKKTYFVLFALPAQRLTRQMWILPIMRNRILLRQIDRRVLILYQFTYI
jgi:hypothetical protein